MRLAESKDPRIAEVLQHFQAGNLYVRDGALVLCSQFVETADGKKSALLLDPLTGEPMLSAGVQIPVPTSHLRNLGPTRRERRTVRDAILTLHLYSSDPAQRIAAAKACGNLGFPSFLAPLSTADKHVSNGSLGKLKRAYHKGDFLWLCPQHFGEYDPGVPGGFGGTK